MDNQISITICGDGGCGKSSITLRIVRGQWTHDYDPTIEDSYSVTRTVAGQTYNLSITDTAGQEEYRSMWSSSNLYSDAFLLVYDITNAESVNQLQYYTDLIREECENRAESRRCLPALMVVGNKCDLKSNRQVSAMEGVQWARERGYGFMETSAREMVNIEETIAAIVNRVVEARKSYKSGQQPREFSAVIAARSPPVGSSSPMQNYNEKAQQSPYLRSDAGSNKRQQQAWDNEKDDHDGKKKGFWASLKCW